MKNYPYATNSNDFPLPHFPIGLFAEYNLPEGSFFVWLKAPEKI